MVEYTPTVQEGHDLALSPIFAALADPTRRAIVHRLARGEATIGELVVPFSMSFQAISKHVQVLERAGLVTRSRRAQQRPCRLAPHALASVASWLGGYRALWEASFDRLDQHLSTKEHDHAAR